MAWRIRETRPERKVLFITAERFMYHFITALRARDVISFKDYFQGIDVLLIDDFQFLQGKSMQQEFCHTFSSLVDSKRRVVVAADVPPAQLESIDQRMRSRLTGGLVVDIEVPEYELRYRILEARLAAARRRDPTLMVGADVIEFIAHKITGGGRELEGALNRVIARQLHSRSRITVELAAMVLRDLAQPCDVTRVRIEDILKVVGRHYNIARPDILSPRRARSIVRPRQVGMYLAKKLTSRSLPEIGRRFGGRDHSTVLHAVRKIEELMASDTRLASEIALLIRLIEQQ
jgi:chromosomal replication initiator protein